MHPTYKRMLEGLQKKEAKLKKATAKSRQDPAAGGKNRERWFLYILKCCNDTFYTGITNDLDRRFKMHQDGKAAKYTRTRRPVELLYQETCGSRSQALIRECEVKGWPRGKKERLIAGEKQVPKRRKKR
jgi:putative endonuclease